MKQVKITDRFDGWETTCNRCGKVIRGRSPSQVNHRMEMHMKSKMCKLNKKKEKENESTGKE